MDYEQKYKDALERARVYKKHGYMVIRATLDNIFPELAESEDGRIRKEIISALKFANVKGVYDKHIAWLEKQGEQKPKFRIGDTIKEKSTGDIVTISEVDLKNKEYRLSNTGFIQFKYEYLWELVEQKLADKVEPKFKVGDWCIDNEDGTIFQIVNVLDNTYTYRTNEGKEYSCSHLALEIDARLWTIHDAKDGDVLASGNVVFIFNKIHGVWIHCHCSLHKDDSFMEEDYDLMNIKYGKKVFPATKEQRELLFSKMRETGYEWNKEKKVPKKIEKPTKWSEEDERLCSCLIEEQEEALNNVKNDKYGHSEIISDFKEMYKERIAWLKSLKERIEQKQEGCEEL